METPLSALLGVDSALCPPMVAVCYSGVLRYPELLSVTQRYSELLS